jgi:hypothetical protein
VKTLEERFWSKVDVCGPDECWEWTAYRLPAGYGTFGRPTTTTHRIAWQLTNGPIPEGMFVCHKCDNPPCVNPAHLFVGTQQDNLRDMWSKGRAEATRQAGKRNMVAALAALTAEQRRANGRKTGSVYGSVYGPINVAGANCVRWNINRGKPCVCGRHDRELVTA